MAEQPVTRYATGSGAHIAYQILGHGPGMVIVPGFASHLEVEWEDGACRSFIRRLAAFATVVRFDKRGTGLSDPVQELPTLQERDADLAAVIAAASPAMARALVESLMLVDVESLLASVSVPTLVVHRTQDVIPVDEGRFLASHIPSSRFRELAGVDHRPWVGDSQAVINEIERSWSGWHPPWLSPSSLLNPNAVVR
jgi:pimeloyl-ACP methyl ester carboxylesterase